MKVTLVRSGTVSANLTGSKPVIIAKNVNNEWFVYKRVSDGQLFLEIPQGADAKSAHAWAVATLAG